MRKNLPVTQREIPLSDADLLISRTDLRGIITYANPGFIRISGYTETELVGQPHNIMRHPDMPEAAFKDLWDTVQLGRSWSGIVKNRCKNGDHYWVKADVTPIRAGAQVVGYTSVRGKATEEEVRFAQALYARWNQGESAAPGLVARLRGIPLSTRLGILMGGLAALFLGLALLLREIPGPGVLLSLVGAGLAVGGAIYLNGNLAAPMGALRDAFRSADLFAQIPLAPGGDMGEVVNGYNILNLRFRRLVQEIGRIGSEVSMASHEIALGNQDLSSRTERQAANLEETASSVEQIASAVGQSSEKSRRAQSTGTEVHRSAKDSEALVGRLAGAMEEIQANALKIADIATLVDEIAFQTNLLALNAAVEAARAGEQGRGFAVVAGEVRALAQRSAGAAKDIKTMLALNADRARVGAKAATEAQGAIHHLSQRVEQLTGFVSDITLAASEQNLGIQEIHKAVSDIDSVTQHNAALVEEAAAATSNLSQQAKDLADLMDCFIPSRAGTPAPRKRPSGLRMVKG